MKIRQTFNTTLFTLKHVVFQCSHSAQNSEYLFTQQRFTKRKYLSDEVPLIMKVE